MNRIILALTFSIVASFSVAEADMTQAKLEEIVKKLADEANGINGRVEFTYNGMEMLLMSDKAANRMRIITPIASYSELSAEHIDNIMHSNFHSALDARYAVSKDILFSAYIHPLSPLTEEQILSAINQVFSLAATFGTAYTSSNLIYNPSEKKSI